MNRLKVLRQEKKLTQKELAQNIGAGLRTIQTWENGESQIKPEKAQKLAEFFGVSVGYLLGYAQDFEKQIRIDTLNDLLGEFNKTEALLLEKGSEDFWKGFTAAELIVQTQKMILEFEGCE